MARSIWFLFVLLGGFGCTRTNTFHAETPFGIEDRRATDGVGGSSSHTTIKTDAAYRACLTRVGRSMHPAAAVQFCSGGGSGGGSMYGMQYAPMGGGMNPYIGGGGYPPVIVTTPGALAAQGNANVVYPTPAYGGASAPAGAPASATEWTHEDARAVARALKDHECRLNRAEGKPCAK